MKLDGIHFRFSRYLKVSEVQVPELSANNNHIWIVEGTRQGTQKQKQKQTNFSSRGTYIMSGMYSMRAKSLYPVPNVTSSTLFLFFPSSSSSFKLFDAVRAYVFKESGGQLYHPGTLNRTPFETDQVFTGTYPTVTVPPRMRAHLPPPPSPPPPLLSRSRVCESVK